MNLYMLFTKDHLKEVWFSLKMCLVFPVAWMCRHRYRNVWLISERPNQARDNGYVLFRYIRTHHPDDPVFYLIDTNSEDYCKIGALGNIIRFDSLKHYFYYCIARVHISSHVHGCRPQYARICKYVKKILKIHDVFVPHGVSIRIAEFCQKKHSGIDLFICCGKPEYENVLANYGYSPDEVAYTGFPRLDIWHHCTVQRNRIVLMPTWRLYWVQNPDTAFTETAYYRAYQDLISHKELSDFLERNHLEMVFYLHHEMRKYAHFFKSQSPNIEMVYSEEQYDIQELLKSAALLITDYSSVHFDFAYMNKPVLYYQFDREEFYQRQYQPGLFDESINGFGPVVDNAGDLVKALSEAWRTRFEMSAKYHENMRSFYPLYDSNNCRRVYGAIQEKFGTKEMVRSLALNQ